MSEQDNKRDPHRNEHEVGGDTSPPDVGSGIPSVVRPDGAMVSRKGIVAVALLVISLVIVSGISIHRALTSRKAGEEPAKRLGDRPTAASGDARRLDMTLAPAGSQASARVVPAIIPSPDERRAEPIPLRQAETPKTAPEDAPVMLVSSRSQAAPDSALRRSQTAAAPGDVPDGPLDTTRRNLETYQRQLQGVVDSLTKGSGNLTPTAPTQPSTPATTPAEPAVGGLFGGELQKSATPRTVAGLLSNRSLVLLKGTAFTCALKTRVISAASGFIGCQVQRNVFSDDGRVLLVERGSHVDGEYRIASVRPGTVRIPVLWTRIRTPNGVTVDIESPGTGALGESGIDGHVDNRWSERIGAAMLLSLIDDTVKLAIEERGGNGSGTTILLPSTTANTGKLAEKVLDSTINIPPLIYQNQGGVVGIYVARDIDFSGVYELKAGER